MSKGNILLVIDSMGIGGAEKVTLTLAQGFINEDYKVDLIICDNSIGFDIPSNVTLHILDFKKSFMNYTRYSKKLHKMIDNIKKQNNHDFDLILVHLQKATRLMRNYNHPNILHTIHSNFTQSALKNNKPIKNFFRKRKLQKIYNKLDIITVSDGIKDDLLHILQIQPKSIRTIYNPIDIDKIKFLSNHSNKLIERNTPYIVHVGRFAKVKRHDILIQAFKNANIDTKLVLVGDGEEKENILTLIKKLNIEDKVILTGFLKNPYPIIKNAKILVLSSEYEGFGNVLVESLILNTMIISTNCKSGPSEIMANGLDKYLVNINDVNDLSTMIESVYNNKYTISSNLIEKFSLNNILQKYIKLI